MYNHLQWFTKQYGLPKKFGPLKDLKSLAIRLVVHSSNTQDMVGEEREQTIYEKYLSGFNNKFVSTQGMKKQTYIAIL